jgi:hypothetical protein
VRNSREPLSRTTVRNFVNECEEPLSGTNV